MKAMNSVIGRVISGRYKIIALAGQGGMGKAYKAIPCLAPAETVVIKLISHRSDLSKVDELHRFQTEAAHLSKLYHPNIVSFYEFGILEENSDLDGFSYYLVMDWVDGESLKEYIEKKVNDLSFFFEIGMQVALALDYTHRKNIIHRDLKPSNIMVRKVSSYPRGVEAVILDFGIARLRQSMHFMGDLRGSSKGDQIGTPLYMSPEQTGFSNYRLDNRTDLYSLGCILFELISGRPPFFRGGRVQILKEHSRSKPPSLKSLVPNIPADIDHIIAKLLAKNPDDRYQSGMQLYLDLKHLSSRPLESSADTAIRSGVLGAVKQNGNADLVNTEQKNQVLGLVSDHKGSEKRGMIVCVQSKGGGGKSKLLEVLQKELKLQKTGFISGEFLDYASSLPFHVISSAFNDFIEYLEVSQEDVDNLCFEAKKRIGDELSLLCALVPKLRKYFPHIEPLNLNTLTEEKNFQTLVKVFADFLKCIGIIKKSLVFMFDDLHKADDFSVKLLDVFVSYSNTQNFVLILTYHPYFLFRKPLVSEFLKKIQQLKRRFFPIVLKPFSLNESKAFVEIKLGLDVFELDIDRIYKVSKGNPRYLANICQTLMAGSRFYVENGRLKARVDLEEALNNARLSSIEQCLMSLEEYSADEWAVLETLSVLGERFTDPLALGHTSLGQRLIDNTIERLQKDGIISAYEKSRFGEMVLSFQFSHYHLRQFIYSGIEQASKRQVHLTMLEYYLSDRDAPSTETLSSTCYHGLPLLHNLNDLSFEIKLRLCKALSKLGEVWTRSNKFLRAQMVYQSALGLAINFPEQYGELKNEINLSLCDLWFKTKSWDEIILLGEKVVNQSIDSRFSILLQKKYLVPAYLIQGRYLKVARLGMLRLESRKLLSQSLKYRLAIRFLKDIIFLRSENFLIQTLLLSLKTEKPTDEEHKDSSICLDLWWLQVLQEVHLNSRILKWLPFHLAAIRLVNTQAYDSLLIVRMLAFRAVLWGQNNQFDRAKRILHLLIDLSYSEQNKQMIGYCSLIKGLVIDYDLNHYGDLKLHLQEGLRYLKPIDHPILVPKALCLRAFLAILAGKFSDADKILSRQTLINKGGDVTKLLCGALQVFIYFIRGRRDLLVTYGEQCLSEGKSLREAGTFEMYFLIISMFMEYAKGDVHKTRECFLKISTYFSEVVNSPFLFTFERDFVSLIIFCIPMFFEQEHQRKLMRQKEMQKLLKSLKSQVVYKKQGERDIFFLLKAKVLSDLGNRSGKKFFEKALKIAFMLGNDLIACFIYLWYGLNLEDLGSKKQEYIYEAYKLACDKKFVMLQSYIESLIKNEPAFYDHRILESTFVDASLPFNTYPTSMALNHLAYISKSFVEGSTYIHSLSNSLKSLQEAYKGGRICIMLANHSEDEIILYPYAREENSKKKLIWEYLQPFQSIEASSFLPSAALSINMTVEEFPQDELDFGETSLGEAHQEAQGAERSPSNVEQTLVSLENESEQEKKTSLDAYVPIQSSSGNLGVLLMRQVPEYFSQAHMSTSSKELDLFGAQLGLVIERDFYSKQSTPYSDQWLSHSIESVPWLRLWNFGKLPNSQISAWSLGLAMPNEQYLIVFCSLQGGERAERQQVSSMLWHHTLVMQVLLKSPDSALSIEYFRDQFASLLKLTPGADSLGDIALGFTLISKGSQKLTSGHFGHARPLVLGGNNQVKPFNDAVMSYDNGRELRFWEVLSSWESHLPLMVCAESYRYAEAINSHIKVSANDSRVPMAQNDEKAFSIEGFFHEGMTPPYYLAVLPNYKGGY